MWRNLIFCVTILSAVVTTPARADVLEVGPSGAAWISGAPKDAGASDRATMVARNFQIGSDLMPASVPEAWRPQVAMLAAKYDLSPALIDALVWQESRWRTGAISSAGASGLTQLMPGTARQVGVDPNDPGANLEGGARYLRMQLDTFGGDVEKALAAYNAGPGRVQAAGGIPRIRETQNYVAAILGRLSNSVRR